MKDIKSLESVDCDYIKNKINIDKKKIFFHIAILVLLLVIML